MGVDVNDAESSINGAAAYLRKIMDGYNATGGPVDINTALYMYNAGPFVKTGYPHGQENREYLPKVLKFAAKYGNGKQTQTTLLSSDQPLLTSQVTLALHQQDHTLM